MKVVTNKTFEFGAERVKTVMCVFKSRIRQVLVVTEDVMFISAGPEVQHPRALRLLSGWLPRALHGQGGLLCAQGRLQTPRHHQYIM